jgi:GDPmannose 4,6-dehydratase
MQWLMLQQEQAEDFVIATGEQHSVREFVQKAAQRMGLKIRFEGQGVDEIGLIEAVLDPALACKVGDTVVRIDPRYFRPAEVETLLGDPTKAHAKLGWKPRTTFDELVQEMADADLQEARREARANLPSNHGNHG